jgi:hypothetical protein
MLEPGLWVGKRSVPLERRRACRGVPAVDTNAYQWRGVSCGRSQWRKAALSYHWTQTASPQSIEKGTPVRKPGPQSHRTKNLVSGAAN